MWTHAVAILAAVAVSALLLRLLWQWPPVRESRPETRIQLRWLLPARPVTGTALPGTPSPQTAPSRQSPPRATAAVDTVPAPVPAAAPVPASAPRSPPLYGSDGQAVLAPDTVGEAKQQSDAERVFEHRDELATGVGERATANLFSGRRAGTRQKRSESLIYGEDIQAAEARRPPDIAFNPARHERPSDLGSEATGDAWKAAPIRYEKAPDLKGEASRRIRAALGDLEQRYPRCSTAQRSHWLAPALSQLETLQRVEYRYSHGADPVEAEHSLPSAADNAYDQARRALWDAERRMKMCT
ncbi:hypothetical protein ARC78_12550 [Stenotrophomonas pictorum JCM 9942]|uniref:Uncharacterized protein n=1 Tax=Stenotrophomonas pictorum JCM 9942 TaxID=1236960 RepID=A0A0R0AEP6_9GAMM|nr:hypothetical protein ARC78_12550 [Stenotrophomonas pictorum JCM 9942]